MFKIAPPKSATESDIVIGNSLRGRLLLLIALFVPVAVVNIVAAGGLSMWSIPLVGILVFATEVFLRRLTLSPDTAHMSMSVQVGQGRTTLRRADVVSVEKAPIWRGGGLHLKTDEHTMWAPVGLDWGFSATDEALAAVRTWADADRPVLSSSNTQAGSPEHRRSTVSKRNAVRTGLATALLAATVGMVASPASANCEPDEIAIIDCDEQLHGGHPAPTYPAPTHPSPTVSAPAITEVVTIGDSYAAGTGFHEARFMYDHWGCMREDDKSHGPRVAADLGADHLHLACEAAGVGGTVNQWRNEGAAFVSGTGENALIVISAGGNSVRTDNDNDWSRVLLRCASPFSNKCHEKAENQPTNLPTVRADLVNLYVEILSDRPDATIRVMGYPQLLQPTPHCLGVTGIHRNEAHWLDGLVVLFNDNIFGAVDTARGATGGSIEFVDVVDKFDDRGACRTHGLGWIHDLTPSGELLPQFMGFHPTSRGYTALYEELSDSL